MEPGCKPCWRDLLPSPESQDFQAAAVISTQFLDFFGFKLYDGITEQLEYSYNILDLLHVSKSLLPKRPLIDGSLVGILIQNSDLLLHFIHLRGSC